MSSSSGSEQLMLGPRKQHDVFVPVPHDLDRVCISIDRAVSTWGLPLRILRFRSSKSRAGTSGRHRVQHSTASESSRAKMQNIIGTSRSTFLFDHRLLGVAALVQRLLTFTLS